MKSFTREQFKEDGFVMRISQIIRHNHQVEPETMAILQENESTDGFTECRRHFAQLGSQVPVFVAYDIESQLINASAINVMFTNIIIFDSMIEYNVARVAAGMEPLLKPQR